MHLHVYGSYRLYVNVAHMKTENKFEIYGVYAVPFFVHLGKKNRVVPILSLKNSPFAKIIGSMLLPCEECNLSLREPGIIDVDVYFPWGGCLLDACGNKTGFP